MTASEIKQLLDKYCHGLCNKKEKQLVEDFLESYQKESKTLLMNKEDIEEKIFSNIKTAISEKKRGKNIHLWRNVLKIAAVILLIVISNWLIPNTFYEKPPEIVYLTKSTLRGQKSNIVLSDGTTIRLNSESSLIFPEKFTNGKRVVTLIGEAFFEVARNPTMPFIVHTDNLKTTVLGTSFNVKAFKDVDTQVTVATGKVKVAPILKSSTQEKREASSEVLLTPNQQATYNVSNNELVKKEVNIKSYLAWKESEIIFDKITFEEASLILERWFNIEIVFENEILKHCIVRSEYINENLINILESLKFIHGIDYRFVENNRVVITGEICNLNYDKNE